MGSKKKGSSGPEKHSMEVFPNIFIYIFCECLYYILTHEPFCIVQGKEDEEQRRREAESGQEQDEGA